MKILFTGGGTGGHFYPILAVIDEIDSVAEEKRLVDIVKYYMASTPFDEKALFDRQVHYSRIPAGKVRAYFSPLNILGYVQTAIGILKAFFRVYVIFPDVILSKGGYDSVPVVVAAKFFGIPVVVHESDAVPGTANRWAGKFARRVGVAFAEAGQHFEHEKVAHIGNPVRRGLHEAQHEGGRGYFKLTDDVPIIAVVGGSQGARALNERILDALPELVKRYYVIHQTGVRNFDQTSHVAKIILEPSEFGHRYMPMPYLSELQLKMIAGCADLMIGRAGAGTIFEFAEWGVPSIIVPLPDSKRDHQKANAFAYARAGAAMVLEQENVTPGVLVAEVDRLVGDTELMAKMRNSAKSFAKPDAARILAEELVRIGLEHE